MERDLWFGEDSRRAKEQQFRGNSDDALTPGRVLSTDQIKPVVSERAESFFQGELNGREAGFFSGEDVQSLV